MAHSHADHHPNKKNVVNRLSRIIGHLKGIKTMVEDDVDCSEFLIQLSAVRSALNNTGKINLNDHINHCLMHAYENDDKEMLARLNDAVGKFLK